MDMVGNKKKILLIELAGIGDAVLSTPAISSLRKCFPSWEIEFLTFTRPGEILKKCPYLDKVFILQKRRLFSSVKNFVILLKLRKQKYNIAINLYQLYSRMGTIKMFLLMSFIKPKKKVGRNTDGRGFFYDIKIEDMSNSKILDVEFKLDITRAIGCRVENPQLELWFDNSDEKRVQKFLKESLVQDGDILIGINPGSHRPSHRWSWKNFALVAQNLSERYKARIIITGTKREKDLATKIYNNMSYKPIISSGNFSLAQLAALIKRCDLYITNDTAPMHMANALKTPLVTIMGPGTMKTAPYQKDNCIILKKDVECSPCYRFRCKDMKCLKMITVDEVMEACERLLKDEKN